MKKFFGKILDKTVEKISNKADPEKFIDKSIDKILNHAEKEIKKQIRGSKKKSGGACIDSSKVPCPKARKYLKSQGLLCDSSSGDEKPRKSRKKKKSILDELLS